MHLGTRWYIGCGTAAWAAMVHWLSDCSVERDAPLFYPIHPWESMKTPLLVCILDPDALMLRRA